MPKVAVLDRDACGAIAEYTKALLTLRIINRVTRAVKRHITRVYREARAAAVEVLSHREAGIENAAGRSLLRAEVGEMADVHAEDAARI